MARYVLLEFDDNEAAEVFVQTIQEQNKQPTKLDYELLAKLVPALTARVRGFFFMPTQFCECPPSDKSVKGAKWGLWIHRDCGKPKKGSWQHPKNLLDPEDIHPRARATYLGVVVGAPHVHYYDPEKGK